MATIQKCRGCGHTALCLSNDLTDERKRGLCIACLRHQHRSDAAKRGWATRRQRDRFRELARAVEDFMRDDGYDF